MASVCFFVVVHFNNVFCGYISIICFTWGSFYASHGGAHFIPDAQRGGVSHLYRFDAFARQATSSLAAHPGISHFELLCMSRAIVASFYVLIRYTGRLFLIVLH